MPKKKVVKKRGRKMWPVSFGGGKGVWAYFDNAVSAKAIAGEQGYQIVLKPVRIVVVEEPRNG